MTEHFEDGFFGVLCVGLRVHTSLHFLRLIQLEDGKN